MVGLRSVAHGGAGAVVSILLSVGGPIGPLAGGFVAGYLEGGRPRDGIIVGLLAISLNFLFYVTIWGVFLWGVLVEYGSLSLPFLITALLVVGLLQVVVTSGACGGLTGYYVQSETDWGRR